MSDAAIEAARAIRLAAHALSNACAAAIGGAGIAICCAAVDPIGQSPRGLAQRPPAAPRPIEEEPI